MTNDDADLNTGADNSGSKIAPADPSRADRGGASDDALDEFPLAIAPAVSTPAENAASAIASRGSGEALDEFPMAIEPLTLTLATPAAGLADRLDDEGQATRPASRAPMWTVAAALLVGLVCGFGGGYLVGGRLSPPDRAQETPSTAATPLTPPATPPSSEKSSGKSSGRSSAKSSGQNDTRRAIDDSPRDSRPAGRDAGGDADRVPRQTDQAIAAVRVTVQSRPAGAQIFVDGRERGRTPATISGLARGAHRLRIVRDGYVVEDRPIVVTAERPEQSVTVSLKRLDTARASGDRSGGAAPAADEGTAVGALDVESRPPDAQLFVDGMLVGTTPFALGRISAGQHSIRLERDGYRRWVASVWIVRGERSRITASLEP